MKIVLACDGGGIRGAATARFLERLEADLTSSIYEIVDLFAGTSTGGLIALGLGGLRLDANEVAGLYGFDNGNKIFNQSFWDRRLGLVQGRPKYDGKGKRDVLKQVFGQANQRLEDLKKPIVITSYDIGKRRPHIFKNTRKMGNPTLVDIADATSAAPSFFPPVQIESGEWLIDGGVVCNNPTMCAYAEAKRLWPDEELRILSIGTGLLTRPIDGEEAKDYGGPEWLMHGLIQMLMEDSLVTDYQARCLLDNRYLRIDSELTQASDDLDDVTRGNLNNLAELGDYWYERFGKQAVSLLTDQISHQDVS